MSHHRLFLQIQTLSWTANTAPALIRSFSSAPNLLGSTISKSRPIYAQLQGSKETDKRAAIFKYVLHNAFLDFDIGRPTGSLYVDWKIFRETAKASLGRDFPPKLDPEFTQIESLLRMYGRPLARDGDILERPQLKDYIFNPTEFIWSFQKAFYPSLDGNRITTATSAPSTTKECKNQTPRSSSLPKDAQEAISLISKCIKPETLVYELGCSNGENLINLLFYTSNLENIPQYAIASDINPSALTMGQAVCRFLGLEDPLVQFYLSNAINPLNPKDLPLKYQNEIRYALRLIPVLTLEDARRFLLKAYEQMTPNKDSLVLSYALTSGSLYEKNMERALDESQPNFIKVDFDGGVTIWEKLNEEAILDYRKCLQTQNGITEEFIPRAGPVHPSDRYILNTYYNNQGFQQLLQSTGFSIQEHLETPCTDNDRAVVNCFSK